MIGDAFGEGYTQTDQLDDDSDDDEDDNVNSWTADSSSSNPVDFQSAEYWDIWQEIVSSGCDSSYLVGNKQNFLLAAVAALYLLIQPP